MQDTKWDQYAYQFAHELCHLLSNFDKGGSDSAGFAWMGEAICEVASLYTLRRMAEKWQYSPPYQNWMTYSQQLYDYAEGYIKSPQRQIPNDISFLKWFEDNLTELENNANDRDKDGLIANYLLSYFENDTKYWEAIKYLNTWNLPNNSLLNYFKNWHSILPDNLRPNVMKLAFEFGYDVEINVPTVKLDECG